MCCLSGMVPSLIRGLNGATLRLRVVDNDRRPCLELLVHLHDLCFERHFLRPVVGALADHKGFDDPTQGVRTKHPVGNNHGSMALSAALTACVLLFAAASLKAPPLQQPLRRRLPVTRPPSG